MLKKSTNQPTYQQTHKTTSSNYLANQPTYPLDHFIHQTNQPKRQQSTKISIKTINQSIKSTMTKKYRRTSLPLACCQNPNPTPRRTAALTTLSLGTRTSFHVADANHAFFLSKQGTGDNVGIFITPLLPRFKNHHITEGHR